MKKAISARIDEDILNYVKNNHNNLNGLINDLLRGWATAHNMKQTSFLNVAGDIIVEYTKK